MTKQRAVIFLVVLIMIPVVTYGLIKIASGYRPDFKKGEIKATGLLSATSHPEGAQVYVDGALVTATDDTVNLDPGSYEIEIKKDGFIPWKKTLLIEKELVTETQTRLFPALPELRPLTTSGALKPKLSPNGSRIAYLIPKATDLESGGIKATSGEKVEEDKSGLWILELSNLPLGFNQEPKQLVKGWPKLADGDATQLVWSPDSRQLLWIFTKQDDERKLIMTNNEMISAAYLINPGQLIESSDADNVSNKFDDLMQVWYEDGEKQISRQMKKLPKELEELLPSISISGQFSPDETKYAFIATGSAKIDDDLISPVPAASSQKQERNLVSGNIYIYDLKEDRNFKIDQLPTQIEMLLPRYNQYDKWLRNDSVAEDEDKSNPISTLIWLPTSRHMIKVDEGKISIIEYDRTNEAVVYPGPLVENFAIPHPNGNSLIISAVLNPEVSEVPNLYSLNLR